jgi:hypothetical protein
MSIIAKHFDNLVEIRDAGGDLIEYVVSRIAIRDLRAVAEYGRYVEKYYIKEWYEKEGRDVRIEAAIAQVLYA